MPFIYATDLPVSFLPKDTKSTSVLTRAPALSTMSSGSNNGRTRQQQTPTSNTIAEALEIARDSPESAQSEPVKSILESALGEIWGKILAQPTSYVMTREEFAVFNYFQDRFEGQILAVDAKKRYWDRYRINSE